MDDLLPLVIFCDVKMPAYNGFDVLKWVRQQRALDGVPFYILSGADLESDKQQAMTLGAKGYLVKFPIPDVWKKIVGEAEM
jgi:CheY-like chemotaxis protein